MSEPRVRLDFDITRADTWSENVCNDAVAVIVGREDLEISILAIVKIWSA